MYVSLGGTSTENIDYTVEDLSWTTYAVKVHAYDGSGPYTLRVYALAAGQYIHDSVAPYTVMSRIGTVACKITLTGLLPIPTVL